MVGVQDTQRAALFRAAVTRHLQYSAWAADGQGVDRHLFGLKKGLKEGGESDRSERQDVCLSTRCFSVNYANRLVSSYGVAGSIWWLEG